MSQITLKRRVDRQCYVKHEHGPLSRQQERGRERGTMIAGETERQRDKVFTLIMEENMPAMPNLKRVGKTKSKLESLPLKLEEMTDLARSCKEGMWRVMLTV